MTKPWADGPFKLIPTPTEAQTQGVQKEVTWVATEMVLAHNMLILNMNAIFLQCEQVKDPKDVSDFLIFCQCTVEEMRTHHEMEESSFFPSIAEYTGEKDIMAANFAQHHAFEGSLEKLEEYLYKEAKPESYDGTKVKKLLEDFMVVLIPHLSDEIPTLLALDKYDGKKLGVIYEAFNKAILNNVKNKHRVLPCGLGAIDRTFEGGKHNFPPFPFFVPYLVHYIFARKYRGSWRFSPCTMFGQPRPLAFAKEE